MFNKEKISELEQEVKKYKNIISSQQFTDEINEQKEILDNLSEQIQSLNDEKDDLEDSLDKLHEEDIADISEIQYMCKFSSQYKQKIDKIRNQQRKITDVIILNKKFNDSLSTNPYLMNKIYEIVAKMMQSNFDIRCDDIMSKVTYNNKTNLSARIEHLSERIEKQIDLLGLKFNKTYIDLKIDEIYMVFEYKCKLQDEKEEKIRQNEILKDQAKADKLIKRNLEKDEKELINLKYKYNKLFEQNKDTTEIQSQIDSIQSNINKNNNRLINKKSGYVYVVGNRDMKDGLVKIGVTKRSIDDRMNELGAGASHSFPMEVYGYVFVDDCYELESKLHKYLNDKRLCVSNPHKEWFIADFDEIKDAFNQVGHIDIDLSESPCEDFLLSYKKFVDFY